MAARVEITYVQLVATQSYTPQVVITYSELVATPPDNASLGVSRMVGRVWVPLAEKRLVGGVWP